MINDISDEILSRLSFYAVGLIRIDEKESGVLGSAILASIEGRRGLLTCGHVAEVYEKRSKIGLARFMDRRDQRYVVHLSDTFTMIVQSSATWTETDFDLAFTHLPSDIAASIEGKGGVFLNLGKNRSKIEKFAETELHSVDAMLGLVQELSGAPFSEDGRRISPLHGILHSGHICAEQNGLLTFEAMKHFDNLPKSFGGMSGAGVWRVFYSDDRHKPEIVDVLLIGIASYQIDERRLACQGWDRVDQGLIPVVREKLGL